MSYLVVVGVPIFIRCHLEIDIPIAARHPPQYSGPPGHKSTVAVWLFDVSPVARHPPGHFVPSCSLTPSWLPVPSALIVQRLLVTPSYPPSHSACLDYAHPRPLGALLGTPLAPSEASFWLPDFPPVWKALTVKEEIT